MTIDFGARSKKGKGGLLIAFCNYIFNISRQINSVTSVRLSFAAGHDMLAMIFFFFFLVFLHLGLQTSGS